MEIDPILERHLTAARQELVAERDRLNQNIAHIDQLIGKQISTAQGAVKAAAREVIDSRSNADVQRDRINKYKKQIAQDRSGPRTSYTDFLSDGGEAASPAMREAVLHYLNKMVSPVKTQDIAKDLADEYSWAESSVRSLISKMARDGEIVGVRRGLYTSIDGLHQDLNPDDNDDEFEIVFEGFKEVKEQTMPEG